MNLVEILKNCPERTKLYSPIYGNVRLQSISNCEAVKYPIIVETNNNNSASFTADGRLYTDYKGECMLFPSKENRDWNTFKVEKSYEFKPFDKVLVRHNKNANWVCDYFSHKYKDGYTCSGGIIWDYCIPYNDDTKHLVGTNKNL